jgi:CO dehydrogenase/acetyl-CoA synthase gamma subunit (corrinoid Fe-S protein)
MPPADLYILRMQWLPYLSLEECRAAGAESCEDFLGRLHNQSLNIQEVPGLSPQKRYALEMALRGAELIPPVEALALPQPTRPGLYEINAPGPQAPILVTGNSEITLTVLSAVLAATVSPFYLLLVDTLGDTLDMALIYERFTLARVEAAWHAADLAQKVQHRTLIIPGLAAALAQPLAAAAVWDIRVGPVCALELPLYFGDYWLPPLGT